MHTLPLYRQLTQFFSRGDESVVCAYLFGSQARGTAHHSSDADIAVLLKNSPVSSLEGSGLDLASEIEERVCVPVDLVILNQAPVDLVHRILRDGILLYEADPSARIAFEVKARGTYFDLIPYLRQYRRYHPETQP
ncbi:MAG: nucleotidyltransferase domain-containing protein [Gammaproteobacteria bacterium]|nr:nucleotidyltransferase domain-containing protein [Gammaproteobacteria bacterium]